MEGYTACPVCHRDMELSYDYDPGVRYLPDGSGIEPSEEFNYECEKGCELDDGQVEELLTRAREAWDQR